MNKLIRDDKVAVLYSAGCCGGWYTNHKKEELLFLPELVALVESNIFRQIDDRSKLLLVEKIITNFYGQKYEFYDLYLGGAIALEIAWIPKGSPFKVVECEGSELVEFNDGSWIIA